jgi:hypothetical protein
MEGGVKITKVGEDETVRPSKTEVALVSQNKPIPVLGGKKHKTLKTFPRGILKTSKIKPVSDPAKHPPMKKGSKKHTIRLLSDSDVSRRRKTIKKKISKMSDSKVREVAVKSGLSKGNAPPKLLREIVEGGMIAGFISSD